jgi:hypothetical protein
MSLCFCCSLTLQVWKRFVILDTEGTVASFTSDNFVFKNEIKERAVPLNWRRVKNFNTKIISRKKKYHKIEMAACYFCLQTCVMWSHSVVFSTRNAFHVWCVKSWVSVCSGLRCLRIVFTDVQYSAEISYFRIQQCFVNEDYPKNNTS